MKTRYRNLRALKLEEWQVHQIANSRKGYWRTAKMLSVALTNSKEVTYLRVGWKPRVKDKNA